jgi:hypothetical protein
MGLTRVLAEPDGASVFGVFVLIVEAVSRQRKPRNGWLTDDGHQTGTAWAPDDLALRWRRTEAEIVRAMQVLSSARVGWIESYDESTTADNITPSVKCPPSALQVPVVCPPSAPEGRKEEKEGREGNSCVADATRAHENSDRPRKQRAPATGAHAELVAYFSDGWRDRFGGKYPVNGGKDGSHIAWILKQVNGDTAKAKAYVDAYLSDNDPFLASGGHNIGLLRSRFAKYVAQSSAPTEAEVIPSDDILQAIREGTI